MEPKQDELWQESILDLVEKAHVSTQRRYELILNT